MDNKSDEESKKETKVYKSKRKFTDSTDSSAADFSNTQVKLADLSDNALTVPQS